MRAEVPKDLVPLPTAPYDMRPDALPLNVEECRTALWRSRGNITKAAQLLKVPSRRLRDFVKKSPYLSEEAKEATEQLVDMAEDQIYDALNDADDKGRADAAAKFVLMGPGRDRGYGSGTKVTVNNSKGGTVVVGWADGTQFSPGEKAKVIEHE